MCTLRGKIRTSSVFSLSDSSAQFTCIASTERSLRYRCLVSIELASVNHRRVVVSIPTLIHYSTSAGLGTYLKRRPMPS